MVLIHDRGRRIFKLGLLQPIPGGRSETQELRMKTSSSILENPESIL